MSVSSPNHGWRWRWASSATRDRGVDVFTEVRRGDIVLYEDAYRNISLAINQGNAAEMFGAARHGFDHGALGERPCGFGRKALARLAARAVVAACTWRLFAGRCAPSSTRWRRPGTGSSARGLAPLAAALEPPRRLAGPGARRRHRHRKGRPVVAQRFPQAEVLGVDLAPAMVEQGLLLPPGSPARVRFEVADAAALSLRSEAFDLVVLMNMIPFFGELARVTAPGGTVVVAHVSGASTPIWTPPATPARASRRSASSGSRSCPPAPARRSWRGRGDRSRISETTFVAR